MRPTQADAAVMDRVSEQDRLWFKARPRRNMRVREYVPGELPLWTPPVRSPDIKPYTIVQRIGDGARMRSATWARLVKAPEDMNDKEIWAMREAAQPVPGSTRASIRPF